MSFQLQPATVTQCDRILRKHAGVQPLTRIVYEHLNQAVWFNERAGAHEEPIERKI